MTEQVTLTGENWRQENNIEKLGKTGNDDAPLEVNCLKNWFNGGKYRELIQKTDIMRSILENLF